MTLEYDPQQVTDWASPLEKVYARQSQQLEEHHRNLRDRDKQEEAAVVDVPELFSKLASFSSSLTQLADARKASKVKEHKANLTRTRLDMLKYAKDTDHKEGDQIIKYASELDNIKKDYSKLTTLVKSRVKAEKLSAEYGDLILSDHGANIIYIRENRAQSLLDAGINTVNTGFKGDVDSQRTWRGLKASNNIQGQQAFIQNFLLKKLQGDLGVPDELIVNKYFDQITTLSNTKGALSKVQIKQNLLTKENQNYVKRIDSVRKAGGNLAHEISKQIKESNKDNVFLNLWGQIDAGELSTYEILDMRTGYIEHAAGDIIVTEENQNEYPGFEIGAKLGTGELLFTDADGASKWHQLEARANAYSKARYDEAVAANEATLTNAIVGIKQGHIKEDQKDQILSTYIKHGGTTSDALYKEFENVQKPDPVIAEIEQERVGEIQLTGRPGQYEDEVENMSQVDFEKWKKDKEAYEANREQNGFGKTTSDDLATNLMTNKLLGLDISITGKKLTPGTQEEIRDFISAKADKLYMKHYLNPEVPRDQIDELTETELNNWLTSKGAFVKATDTENADFGILTSDGQGGFPGWEAQKDSKIERTKGTHPQRTVRNVINELNEYKTIDNLLKNGKGITNAELLAVIDNIKDGKLTAFPPDVLLKGRIYGKQPSAVILSKLEYLENPKTTADKNFVKRFDLDSNTVKNLKAQLANSSDIQIREILKGINDGRTLLSHYNKSGLAGFSSNQFNTIIKNDEKKRVAAQKEKEKLEEEAENFKNSQAGKAVEDLSNK